MNAFIIFLYFILFPFGQLLRLEIAPFGIHFAFHILDSAPLLSIPFIILTRTKPHPLRKYFYYFWCICLFSLLLATVRYPLIEVIRGSFYLLRFISYYFFFEVVWQYIKEGNGRKEKVLSLIVYSLLVTALLGWLQYLYSPDLRYLKLFHWDDHLNRLTGTLLDPGFMGILMAMAAVITGLQFFKTRKISHIVLSIFFFITMLFTYARASYIALVFGIIAILFPAKRIQFGGLILALFAVVILLLPKGAGEGVYLLRTNSIFQKMTNYEETVSIIPNYPIFGVGYNTLCSERVRKFGDEFDSHACSGSDSSILFIIATTGVLGLFAFIKILIEMVHSLKPSSYATIFIPISIALLIHSLFLNSLVYPWVLGVIFTMFALAI